MQESLKDILSIQELDIKMIRLMQMKKARQDELLEISSIHSELLNQLADKEDELKELDESCGMLEQRIKECTESVKKLESHQSSIKKIDEFNALTKEISQLEKEKASLENELSLLVDQKAIEEEVLEKTKETLKISDKNNVSLKKEIHNTISKINLEGKELKAERNIIASRADKPILAIYEKLLRNKKDRVVVAIENRICQGCHISLTAQHEVLVRKKENLVFCDHCSRIHYWAGADSDNELEVTAVRRRRRKTSAS
jgi:predicted  nucleic acid-binding Zn-ribbon protein